jgi:phosphonate transport system ATP-binding protein
MILADEPVASLDPATADTILSLLRSICKEDGITAIVSLHQLDFARRFADRIIGIADAQVVSDGAAAELDDVHLARIYSDGPRRRLANPERKPAYLPRSLQPTMEMSL